MKLLSQIRDRIGSSHWQDVSVLLMRLTRKSILHRKSYSDVPTCAISGHLKVQVNAKAVVNYERPKCASYEFAKGRLGLKIVKIVKKNPTFCSNSKCSLFIFS